MEKVAAISYIDDYMLRNGIPKTELEKLMKKDLARKLSDCIVEKKITDVIVKRNDKNSLTMHPYSGVTEYILELCIITKEEHDELQYLRQSRDQFRNFINSGGNF